MPKSNVPLGIVYIVTAFVFYSVMDTIIKYLGDHIPTTQLFFFRCLFAFLPILVLIRLSGGFATLRTQRFFGHVFRSLATISFLLCLFYSFTLMPIANVYAITFAAPLFVAALSLPILGERPTRAAIIAVLIGFAGVLIILRPGGDAFSLGGMIALIGAVLQAIGLIFVRQLSRTESAAAIVFYFSLTGMTLSGLTLPFVWVTPTAIDWFWLVAIGLIGGTGQVFMTIAYRLANASTVAPFQYTQIVWGVLFGYAIFGDTPDLVMLLGAAVVIGSGFYLVQGTVRARPQRA